MTKSAAVAVAVATLAAFAAIALRSLLGFVSLESGSMLKCSVLAKAFNQQSTINNHLLDRKRNRLGRHRSSAHVPPSKSSQWLILLLFLSSTVFVLLS